MNPVNFSINGRPMRAAPGETVLSVARRNDIPIPTLCHHEALTSQGSCRLCVVEVSWGDRSKLVTSCIYTPYEEDRIETDTPRVRTLRRLVIELLLARCPNVDVLQRLGWEYGVKPGRLAPEDGRGKERCILCGLCVRVCDEVVGQHAIGYEGRGVERRITTPFNDHAAACIGCGACVYVCPTSALHYEDVENVRIMKEFQTRVELAQCRQCGRRYAPAVLIEKVTRCAQTKEDDRHLCPACRRRTFAERMSAWMQKQLPDARANGDRLDVTTRAGG